MRRDLSKISVFPVHKRSWHCGKRGLIVHIVPVQIEACKSDFGLVRRSVEIRRSSGMFFM